MNIQRARRHKNEKLLGKDMDNFFWGGFSIYVRGRCLREERQR